MFKTLSLAVLAVSLIFVAASCVEPASANDGPGNSPVKAESSPSASAVNTEGATLLFSMNPNGRPCQIQDEILGQVKTKIEAKMEVKYVKTTIPGDRDMFYKYGVRGLPSMVIVNGAGDEIKRFSPGIQPPDALISAALAL